jgi:uroporphyrinogen-III synthase
MAMARVDDVAYTVRLADEMLAEHEQRGAICLLQCGRPSTTAAELSQELTRLGRRVVPLLIKDREQAQSDAMLVKLAGASAVWVFADDMLETFLSLFATQLAFELRSKAKPACR